MDVIVDGMIVNYFLGSVYLVAAVSIFLLMRTISKTDIDTWKLIMSKKSLMMAFFGCILVTCLTVSYQNFFSDYSSYLLWWRPFLISAISEACWKWAIFAHRVVRTKTKFDKTIKNILRDKDDN